MEAIPEMADEVEDDAYDANVDNFIQRELMINDGANQMDNISEISGGRMENIERGGRRTAD